MNNDSQSDESMNKILSSIRSIVDDEMAPSAKPSSLKRSSLGARNADDLEEDDPIIDLTQMVDKSGKIVELPLLQSSSDGQGEGSRPRDDGDRQHIEKLAVPMIRQWIEENLSAMSGRMVQDRLDMIQNTNQATAQTTAIEKPPPSLAREASSVTNDVQTTAPTRPRDVSQESAPPHLSEESAPRHPSPPPAESAPSHPSPPSAESAPAESAPSPAREASSVTDDVQTVEPTRPRDVSQEFAPPSPPSAESAPSESAPSPTREASSVTDDFQTAAPIRPRDVSQEFAPPSPPSAESAPAESAPSLAREASSVTNDFQTAAPGTPMIKSFTYPPQNIVTSNPHPVAPGGSSSSTAVAPPGTPSNTAASKFDEGADGGADKGADGSADSADKGADSADEGADEGAVRSVPSGHKPPG